MKQVLQSLSNGSTFVDDLPCPNAGHGQVLIESSVSLVSLGTERMLVDFGKANFFQKARSQPDKVKQVLEKVKTDGVLSTYEAVSSKLNQPLTLGYSNVGVVNSNNGTPFRIGDRVVSNGPHAEIVAVSKHLCAAVPDNVSDEEAAFTVPGSIALHGVRLCDAKIGETVVVIGLGLVGLLAVQLLLASGCSVVAIDLDENKCALAAGFGATSVFKSVGRDATEAVLSSTNGFGADSVLIAAASQSNDIISEATNLTRKRGKIILVGSVGLNLSRSDFYEKEISFQVSCSYGPGRYDPVYEKDGQDYPYPYVRWTEQRNFEAFLQMLSTGRVSVKSLITSRYNIDDAADLYTALSSKDIGIIIDYRGRPSDIKLEKRIFNQDSRPSLDRAPRIAFIGSGNHASRTLIPAFCNAKANFAALVSYSGVSASHFGKKFKFRTISTDENIVSVDKNTDAVVVATRHNLHAKQVCKFLSVGKSVFVEKPLALNISEVDEIQKTYSKLEKKPVLMVGYNRRFSQHTSKLKMQLRKLNGPKNFIFTVNAGYIPYDHWVHDMNVGGGRLIGEACHFIDLMRYFADSSIKSVDVKAISTDNNLIKASDNFSLHLSFDDGSQGVIAYFSNGSRSFPKERIEVFCDGYILRIKNFLKTEIVSPRGTRSFRTIRQDKGFKECAASFLSSVESGDASPIPFNEVIEVATVSCQASQILLNN